MESFASAAAEALVQSPIAAAVSTDMLFVPPQMTVADAARSTGGTVPIIFTGTKESVQGMITLKSLLDNLSNPDIPVTGAVGYVPREQIVAIPDYANLGQALQLMDGGNYQVMPVMDKGFVLKGYVPRESLNRALFGSPS